MVKEIGGEAWCNVWGKYGCRYQLHWGLSSERVNDFKNGSIDCLFIDGDHTKSGVKKDIELYAMKVRRGGTIYFDDVATEFPGVVEAVFEMIIGNNLTLWPVGRHNNYRISTPIDAELNTSFSFNNDSIVLPRIGTYGQQHWPIYLGAAEDYGKRIDILLKEQDQQNRQIKRRRGRG